MNIKNSIFREITSFSKEHLRHLDYFVLVYGSYASGHYRNTSDVDVFIVVEQYNNKDFTKSLNFLTDLHVRYNLKIDNEVPYTNKLIVSYKDVMHAIALDPFTHKEEGYHIPPIRKSKKFLSSQEIRWRLILNALTSPHLFIYGNKEKYLSFKNDMEKSIVRLALGLMGAQKPTVKNLTKILLTSAHGEKGEMYLGYKKERKEVVEYLKSLIERNSTLPL